jgi:hypothetical protein
VGFLLTAHVRDRRHQLPFARSDRRPAHSKYLSSGHLELRKI